MKKIITLFQRNHDGDKLVIDKVTPGAEWVIAGEGIATRKWDGCCCMIRDSKLYKRYELKKRKQAPPGFEPAQDADAITGDTPGWLPVGSGSEDKWFRAAFEHSNGESLPDGTYEAIGPHFQGNSEGCICDMLVLHGKHVLPFVPRDYEALKHFMMIAASTCPSLEGVVWHHPDGRMVQIKARDYGFGCLFRK